jgi:2,3-bisphosphoglycerate-dependent phosphoglycerate mutase
LSLERIVIARHGESDYSARGLLNGDSRVPVGLTDAGRDQARALGVALEADELDVCVTSAFPRVRETAELAVGGRGLPTVVAPELGDPGYGVFEGRPLEEYRAWASSAPASEPAPGGGESRVEIITRYLAGFRALAARPERVALVVAHSLPIAYLLAAVEGSPPRPRVELAAYATPYRFERPRLERAIEAFEAWLRAPDW